VPRLADLPIGLRVRCVRDVVQMAGSDRHVVHRVREARQAWSPRVIVDVPLDAACTGVCAVSLPALHLLPLQLELDVFGLLVSLSAPEPLCLLPLLGGLLGQS
jgi:hypothetical protein